MKAFLILEDGHVFEGKSIGSTDEIISEIVFNTSMTGYLEILTDPSYAKEHGYDIFTTTLSISPHKNVQWLNEIGEFVSRKYDIEYLFSDFKKKDGYRHSIQLSKEYGLYRQNFCGCEFSKKAAEERDKLNKK